MYHVDGVNPGSLADKAGIKAGEAIVRINGEEVTDGLMYGYLVCQRELRISVCDSEKDVNGKGIRDVKIVNNFRDIGIINNRPLVENPKRCRNKCVFCFIDQLPKGLRAPLYFKDDDARLSFLTGNYVTLTNLSDEEFNGIIKMRLSPVNISVHTVNDELRCKMLGNPDSGGIVAKIRRLTAQNITVNAQIVLCKNYNDGAGLINSIKVLHAAGVNSLSVVPVGLTKYRDGLPPLEPFSKEDCKNIIKIIEKLSKVFYEKYGTRFVYPADEFFIKGEVPIPRAAYYDGFGQIENGVGLLASLTKEFNLSLTRRKTGGFGEIPPVTVGVSVAAHDTVKSLIDKFNQKFNSQIGVIKIENVFFGSDITVAGLLTGQDIIGGLKGKNIEKVLLPRTILRSDGDLTLDGMTVADIERNICARVEICDVDGKMLIDMLLGLE